MINDYVTSSFTVRTIAGQVLFNLPHIATWVAVRNLPGYKIFYYIIFQTRRLPVTEKILKFCCHVRMTFPWRSNDVVVMVSCSSSLPGCSHNYSPKILM